MAEQEIRVWLLDIERRLTRLETQIGESRLRQVNISTIKVSLLSVGMALVIWILNLVAARLGWM